MSMQMEGMSLSTHLLIIQDEGGDKSEDRTWSGEGDDWEFEAEVCESIS
jgi:hypothetical protein